MPEEMSKAESYMPESVKLLRSIGTPQENIDKFGKDAPKNLLDEEEARKNRESEARAYSNHEMEEERSKSDPEFQRMVNAESPKDISPYLETLRRQNDTDFGDAIEKYGDTRALSIAWKRSMIFEKGHGYLTDPNQLIVVKRNDRRLPGTIQEDGRIGEDSVPRVSGYSIYVDTKIVEVPDTLIRKTYDKDGNFAGHIEETSFRQVRKETVNYGTSKERRDLSKAYLEFTKQGIVTDQVYDHANLMWNLRAALEGLVRTVYTKEIIKSNYNIQSFFTAPEISEMSDNPENKKVGEKRDKATRLLELVGNCETKEKLEAHLNSTFNLESILDNNTQNRVLGYMKEVGWINTVALNNLTGPEVLDNNGVSERYKLVVEFLIGKNITITKDDRDVLQYKLGAEWLTADQRDPSKTNVLSEKKERGKNAVDKKEKNTRGFLTKIGNPYIRSRDEMTAVLSKISMVVGDSIATGEAHRNFYWWGEPDWLGAEIYAKDSLPNGAELAKKRSELRGQDWLNYAKEVSSYFATGGEPNGTDLIKLFWPDLYRLKDFVAGQGRPTGQYVTIGGIDHLAQSVFGIARSDVKINGVLKTRNLREQWLGSKDTELGVELPKNLGDIEWMSVGGPTEVLEELLSDKVGKIDWPKVDAPDSVKDIIKKYKGGETAELIDVMNNLVDTKPEGISAGVEGFYWLMNFLVGDENEVKRMWTALNADLKPDTLTVTSGFTGKIKFMDITQGAQGPYDGYIAAEKRAVTNGTNLKNQVENEGKKRAKNYLRTWYKGVKGDPSYRIWAHKQFDLMGPNSLSKKTVTNGEYVDSLAEMYDFADLKDVRKPLDTYPRLNVDIK